MRGRLIQGIRVNSNETPDATPDAPSQPAQETATNTADEIAALHARAKASADGLETTHQALKTALATLGTLISEAQGKATLVEGLRTEIASAKTSSDAALAIITSNAEQIKTAAAETDTLQKEMNALAFGARQSSADADTARTKAQASQLAITEASGELATNRAAADVNLEAIALATKSAKASQTQLEGLAATSTVVEQKIADYESTLSRLQGESEQRLGDITRLLPGATSAGLASSFDKRGKDFIAPSKRWQWGFVASLVAIIVLALTGLWRVYTAASPLGYDELFRLWLSRLPIAGALIWLALHAARESALAKRLEEDYAYKSAVASSFLGFHEQMLEMGAKATPGSPLAILCTNTLSTIANEPGRIYDKHKLTTSPSDEFKGLLDSLQNSMKFPFGDRQPATPTKES